MPPAVAGLAGSCASIPCRFSFPEELRPGSVQGLWFFGSPYPRHYPPVVARSRPGATHESFAGRARLVGEPALRSCALELGPPLSAELAGRYYFRVDLGGYNQTFRVRFGGFWGILGDFGAFWALELGPPLSAELAGRYYFRVDLGGYNQYSFSEHAALQVLGEWIWDEPQVLEVSGPAEALEGSEVHLGCRAEGRPAPLLTWFRGPQVLREEPGAAELPLHLAQVSPEDSGTYTCVAENRHGRHNRSLELHVAYAPCTPVVNGTLWVLADAPRTPMVNGTLWVLAAGLVWAKVGPVGAVVAFAVVIALVCYLSQSRRK
ncbi:Schwann cell myelin protein [Lonchura striata]|uniref:Schwann cell myelin protein n=1 Tax=Lonchura striata TaxID=40157 RepID=A0A218U747_9PASE|nr:Schwann cell myelin protein [Lonchura striata domestica]